MADGDRDVRRSGDGSDGAAGHVGGAPNGVRSRVAQRYGTPLAHAIQRRLGDDADRAPTIHDAATAAVEQRGSGAPVNADVAQRVGGYLGADLAGVRVHDDPLSQQATAAMGARAFAYGNDVFLGQGERGNDLAYFNGNIAGLRSAVDAATSAGTFNQWVTFMQADQYAQADALM